MDKQLLIGGSVLAVVVLVLAGLSPVVGYNSIESGVKDSPLFHLRTQRAIDKEQNIKTRTYLGKGRATDILLPTRINHNELVEKAINRIIMMDDESFDKFIDTIIKYQLKNNIIYRENTDEIMTMLYQLKNNPDEIQEYIVLDDESTTSMCSLIFTYCGRCELVAFLIGVLLLLLSPILIPLFFIYLLITVSTCHGLFC